MLSQLLNTLLNDFIKLRSTLLAEQGEDWLPGIEHIIRTISKATEDITSAYYFVESAKRTYVSMYSGTRGFSDFFIWRNDFEERKTLNVEFDKFKKKINHNFSAIFDFYCK